MLVDKRMRLELLSIIRANNYRRNRYVLETASMIYITISFNDYKKLKDKSGAYEVLASGIKAYYINNKLHREGEPSLICADGSVEYDINNKLHRLDGPAVIRPDGHRVYYKGGKHHRLDCPAIIYTNRAGCYYVNDEEFSKEDLIKMLTAEQMKRFLLNPENF